MICNFGTVYSDWDSIEEIMVGRVITECNGIAFNESGVCNGNGNCTFDEECNCTSAWTGQYCTNPERWKGQYCNVPICKNDCNGNGTCVEPEKCKCNVGFYNTDEKFCVEGFSNSKFYLLNVILGIAFILSLLIIIGLIIILLIIFGIIIIIKMRNNNNGKKKDEIYLSVSEKKDLPTSSSMKIQELSETKSNNEINAPELKIQQESNNIDYKMDYNEEEQHHQTQGVIY